MNKSAQRSKFWLNLFFLIALFVGLTGDAIAQSASEAQTIYINLNGLSTDDYAVLVKACRENSSFDLTQACVPVGLLEFKAAENNSNTLAENFAAIKALISAKTGKNNAELLADFNAETFLNSCKAFRNGSH
ncbi:MAG: hypothetical protein P8N19_00860 [Flavobacteriales bacterium]|nr:hypothetical protein [Flavobacteriales bacterium]MDG1767608.1 hypothetical protein [Flavobacteriales bacterium]